MSILKFVTFFVLGSLFISIFKIFLTLSLFILEPLYCLFCNDILQIVLPFKTHLDILKLF